MSVKSSRDQSRESYGSRSRNIKKRKKKRSRRKKKEKTKKEENDKSSRKIEDLR